MGAIKNNFGLPQEGAPISAKDFKELVRNFNQGGKALTIDKDGCFVLINKSKFHDVNKLFKKISNFSQGKISAESALKKRGEEIEKIFPELGKLILHIEKSQRKTGLGVSAFMKNHSRDIEMELAKTIPGFNKTNFCEEEMIPVKEFFSIIDAKSIIEANHENKIFQKNDDKNKFIDSFSVFRKYLDNPNENSLFNKEDFDKIKYCGIILQSNIELFSFGSVDFKKGISAITNKFEKWDSQIKENVADIKKNHLKAEKREFQKHLDVINSIQ